MEWIRESMWTLIEEAKAILEVLHWPEGWNGPPLNGLFGDLLILS